MSFAISDPKLQAQVLSSSNSAVKLNEMVRFAKRSITTESNSNDFTFKEKNSTLCMAYHGFRGSDSSETQSEVQQSYNKNLSDYGKP